MLRIARFDAWAYGAVLLGSGMRGNEPLLRLLPQCLLVHPLHVILVARGILW